MTAVAAAAVHPGALPRSFLAWLGAATLSTYGDSALYFALGWTAAGIGPLWAGLVVTVITLPRTVLLLVGGAVGDRWGPRRVMICDDAVMCVVTLLLALLVQVGGVTVWLLLSAGLVVGIVDAFYLPSTGSFPRLFVDDDQLSRAFALRGSFSQASSLVGGPVSGVFVAVAGLIGTALVDAATFAAAGLLVTAAGMTTLAVSAVLPLSVAAAVAQGLGTGLFATRVGPLLLAGTPRSHLTREQSLISVVQAAPLMLSANLLGAIADATGVETATITCAVGTAVAAALLLRQAGAGSNGI